MSEIIKQFLTEEEKSYIKHNILDAVKSDLDKALLFESIPRIQVMLESSIKRLKFDHDLFEARSVVRRMSDQHYNIAIEARKKNCEEIYSFDKNFILR